MLDYVAGKVVDAGRCMYGRLDTAHAFAMIL